MITKLLIDILLFPISSLLDGMGAVSLSIPENIFDGLNSIFGLLGFLFPISGLLIILGASFTIKFSQTIWALILRIKNFIPTMGA